VIERSAFLEPSSRSLKHGDLQLKGHVLVCGFCAAHCGVTTNFWQSVCGGDQADTTLSTYTDLEALQRHHMQTESDAERAAS
jgi:hypothetical protein